MEHTPLHTSPPPHLDLARSYPGRQVGIEATRRRTVLGPGADRNWRVGADGEQRAARLLESLVARRRHRDRLLHRPPGWRVLHSIPLDDGHADIDHLVVGPPGVVVVNTRHHRGGRVLLDGDTLVVDGVDTTAVTGARREAARTRELLEPRLPPDLRTVPIRPAVALMGAAMQVRRWPDDVIVVTEGALVAALLGLAPALDAGAVHRVHDVARHAGTWAG